MQKGTRLIEFVNYMIRLPRSVRILSLVVPMIVIYVVILHSGGIVSPYLVFMAFPVLLASLFYKIKVGLITSFVAGILVGPLTPNYIIIESYAPLRLYGEYQEPIDMAIMFLSFFLAGLVISVFSHAWRTYSKRIQEMYSHHPGTMIPNMNYLKTLSTLPNKLHSAAMMTVLINNIEMISLSLGVIQTRKALDFLYKNVMTEFKDQAWMVQAEANKFWIVVSFSDSSAEIKSLLKALKKEIVVNKIPLYLEYSIGYAANKALYECANLDAFISSDLSARIAKETNQSFLIYDESVQKKQLDVDLLGHFAKALEEGNTHLVFQPIINLSSNQVNGFESLIRWKHHLYGLIPPSTFIPLAEDTELIHTMTSCVIRESISLIQTLQSININLPVSINVSIRNLYHPHFIEELDKSLQVAGLEVGQLELEIAERNLYANKAKSLQILEELSRRHYVVAIDDFGDSKSMMSFSSGFVAQTLKIDQCFIRDVATNERIKQLLSQTVTLAHDYGYKVLAEGVEDENTHKICKELGFDDAQGYFYALPMNKEDLLYYLKNHLPKKQVEVVE